MGRSVVGIMGSSSGPARVVVVTVLLLDDVVIINSSQPMTVFQKETAATLCMMEELASV